MVDAEPVYDGMRTDEVVSVRVPVDLLARAREHGRANERSVAQTVRHALREFLDAEDARAMARGA